LPVISARQPSGGLTVPAAVTLAWRKGRRTFPVARHRAGGGAWAGALLSQTDSLAVAALVWTLTVVWLGIVRLAGSVMLECGI
jgi:hypothetical protein